MKKICINWQHEEPSYPKTLTKEPSYPKTLTKEWTTFEDNIHAVTADTQGQAK